MSINNLSVKDFLNSSSNEQQKILSQLRKTNNEYNEFKIARDLARLQEEQKKILYNVYKYDGSLTNISNRLFVLGHNEGYEILLSDEKLNEIEEYGLTNLMVDSITSHNMYDIYANIYIGYQYNEYEDCINIYNNYQHFDINNIKDKLMSNLDLTKYKYAYVLHYKILCQRKNKSLLWRMCNRRKCDITKHTMVSEY